MEKLFKFFAPVLFAASAASSFISSPGLRVFAVSFFAASFYFALHFEKVSEKDGSADIKRKKKPDNSHLADSEKNRKLVLYSKRMEKKAEYFERILQDSTDIIFTLDQEGYIFKFNKGAEETFGYHQYNIVGKPFRELLYNRQDSEDIFNIVLRESHISNSNYKMKSASGDIIYVSMSMSEMKGEKNDIMGFVVTCQDISEKKHMEDELREKNRQLEELAITDNLSGLYNVRYFHAQLRKHFAHLRRNYYKAVGVMLIDIDHFKQLNDTEGHQAGDMVIEKVGSIINKSIRSEIDLGFRYGGDEFVIILPDTDKHSSIVVANRILDNYKKESFGNTSLSIGITDTVEEFDEETIVRRADDSMYKAKRGGGNRYCLSG
ncbi:MAG: diguanylate cyclase [Fibrobacterota bacterium]